MKHLRWYRRNNHENRITIDGFHAAAEQPQWSNDVNNNSSNNSSSDLVKIPRNNDNFSTATSPFRKEDHASPLNDNRILTFPVALPG
jgi:hypothetical protein